MTCNNLVNRTKRQVFAKALKKHQQDDDLVVYSTSMKLTTTSPANEAAVVPRRQASYVGAATVEGRQPTSTVRGQLKHRRAVSVCVQVFSDSLVISSSSVNCAKRSNITVSLCLKLFLVRTGKGVELDVSSTSSTWQPHSSISCALFNTSLRSFCRIPQHDGEPYGPPDVAPGVPKADRKS
ncbi:hypothetical protein ON010_g5612 [Phytophthora cinnamomi]|nr:hypothetical protein ON010_g5612 [Phytophthora cinnamomi]